MEKMKILGRQRGLILYPNSIPFEMLSEEMAKKNHGQTLSGLNSRGGLSVMEILANLKNDRVVRGIETQKDVDELNSLIKKYQLNSLKTEIINFALEAITRLDEKSVNEQSKPLYECENDWLTIDELYDKIFIINENK